jgi:hypothetical protein
MSIYVLRREIFSPKHWGVPARLPPFQPGSRQNLTRTFNCTPRDQELCREVSPVKTYLIRKKCDEARAQA